MNKQYNYNMTFILITLAIGFITFLIIGAFAKNKISKLKKIELDNLNEKGISFIKRYDTSQAIIGFDEDKNLLVILYTQVANVNTFEIELKDIISFEILKDGVSISNKSVPGVVGGAIVGGMLAGGVGSLIGALSTETVTREKIKSISMKILTSNSYSAFNFSFSDTGIPITQAALNANQWHDLLTIAIHNLKDKKQSDL